MRASFFVFFFSRHRIDTGIVVQQLWSFAFRCKHEVWAPVVGVVAGMTRHVYIYIFFFLVTGPRTWCPSIHCISVLSISHRPARKDTLASDLKGAGDWAPPAPPCAHHWLTWYLLIRVQWNSSHYAESNTCRIKLKHFYHMFLFCLQVIQYFQMRFQKHFAPRFGHYISKLPQYIQQPM